MDDYLAVLGLICLICPYVFLDKDSAFPGMTALPSVIGACLLIRFGNYGVIYRLLASKPFVGIGKISYSLYLWHWPIIVFWTYCTFDKNTALDYAGMLVLSFVCAYLSWRFVEMPTRLSKRWTPKVSLWVTLGGWLVIGGLAFFVVKSEGCRKYLHPEANKLEIPTYWSSQVYYEKGKKLFFEYTGCSSEGENPLEILGDKDKEVSFLVWGDSHAQASAYGFHRYALEQGISGLFVNRTQQCFYGYDYFRGKDVTKESQYLDDIFVLLKDHPKIKTVYLMMRWSVKCEGTLYSYEEGDNKNYLIAQGKEYKITENNHQAFKQGLVNTCNALKAMNKKVIILNSVPEQLYSVPQYEQKRKVLGYGSDNEVSIEMFSARQKNTQRLLSELEQEGWADVIDIAPILLNEKTQSYKTVMEGKFLYIDDDHLSPFGAEYVIPRALERHSKK